MTAAHIAQLIGPTASLLFTVWVLGAAVARWSSGNNRARRILSAARRRRKVTARLRVMVTAARLVVTES